MVIASIIASIIAGAVLLIWPALWNGYPLLFSDTGGLIEMSLEPTMGWDKPWIYGPFLHLFHWRHTLWPCVSAQGLIVSHVLWLVARTLVPGVRAWSHVALCALLSGVSAAPWFAALLMPDVFTAPVVLCLFLLGFGRISGREAVWVGVVGTVAIASHLAHLILAAGVIGMIGLMRVWRWLGRGAPSPLVAAGLLRQGARNDGVLWRPVFALVGAVGLLLVTNWVGLGRPAISPNGSVFALARLIGDGPGRDYIDRVCPEAKLTLCAWQGRLAHDSDTFLWAPQGPLWDRGLWGDEFGPVALAPEAARLVPAIIAAYPLQTAMAALRNAARQFVLVAVGDALVPDYLDDAVLPKLMLYFPADEVRRYRASRQHRGMLADDGRPFTPLHIVCLLMGGAGTAWIVLTRWRERTLWAFAALVLTGLAANAVATGALSAPHDRYQARIAWLVLLPPLYAAMAGTMGGAIGARRATSSGDIRTSAS